MSLMSIGGSLFWNEGSAPLVAHLLKTGRRGVTDLSAAHLVVMTTRPRKRAADGRFDNERAEAAGLVLTDGVAAAKEFERAVIADAKARYVADCADSPGFDAAAAWEDMGGSEPSVEWSEYVIDAEDRLREARTPHTLES
jgi:hypothetical protein